MLFGKHYFDRVEMDVDGLIKLFGAAESSAALDAFCLAQEQSVEQRLCSVGGLYGSSKALLIAATLSKTQQQSSIQNVPQTPKIHIVVADNKESAEYLCSDLYQFLPTAERVFYFPQSASNSKFISVKDSSNRVQRSMALSAINSLIESEKMGDSATSIAELQSIIVVTYPDSVKELVVNRKSIVNSILRICKNNSVSFEKLRTTLFNAGFEMVDFVYSPGEFSIRGGIVDIFSFSDNVPYRLSFFGDTVESIKKFDINSQRSIDEAESVEIFPNIYQSGSTMALGGENLFDYIPDSKAIIWNDTYEHLEEFYKSKKVIYLSGKPIKTPIAKTNAEVDIEAEPSKEPLHKPLTLKLQCSPQPSFNKNFALLADHIRKRERDGYKVIISSSSDAQIERIRAIFKDSSHIAADGLPLFEALPQTIHEGFECEELKLCLFTEHQIFERYHKVSLRREVAPSDKITMEDLAAFHIGDYVVHIDHGVGIFGGLVKTNINGRLQEAIKISYRDNDVIFVSVHGLHKISKYRSKDTEPPKIHKLGSGAWNKLKATTKAKIKDIAKELIELYAKRKQADGFAFSPDSFLQNELEASFIFEDTPDQLTATKAIKQDMESPHPMDRLICGDVGFGKTELAIRAAFKAVCDSKQVCVLVPTTILAFQHYNTFRERLSQFPCTIEYMSRLKSAGQIKEIVSRLKEGKIDIIIGTHRLLNKQIEFKDLGLLIIDEEQKFGVAAKERLRQLKVEVDTLTLTATPIPRTLQFSLLGARDLSILTTPPPNRLPVQTEIISFNEEHIKEAIENELKRGGQLFFVHNRVEDILAVEQMILRLCPKARTIVGHGQMDGNTLENRMLEFIRGDYDVLISTTIIENGIDIPNANTIIINSAQNFGLSDLHQLRGRVGRSNQKAYCYLIVPPMASLTEDAKRRLKAIEAFSELGSGFNIAMQDLDIRGAGNLLGGEQSGFIADMGFETYQRILNEAFVEINSQLGTLGSAAKEREDIEYVADCIIDTDLELFIPDEYVSQTSEKIRLYKELDAIKSDDELARFMESLRDRFGDIPEQVSQLSYVVRMRRKAITLGFEKIVIKGGVMLLYFISDVQSAYYRSEIYSQIINNLQRRRVGAVRFNEQQNKLWIRVAEVRSIEQGYKILASLEG